MFSILTQQLHGMESQSSRLHSQSLTSSPSLSSQPSLPSVPSLTTPSSFNNRRQPDEPSPAVNHHDCIATLTRRACQIFSLALSGKFLYSGCSNSEIRAWSHDYRSASETDDDSLVATTSNGGPVKSLVVLGERIFSGHQDHKIRVWKIEHRNDENTPRRFYTCIATLPTFNDRFLKCFFPKNYVQVRRHRKRTWVHHVDAVSALATSADGSLLFSASWDRSFKVWRTSDYKCVASVSNAHDDAINAIVVSRDGVVYTGSADKKIKAWEIHAREKMAVKHALVDTMEAHKSAVNALAANHDGSVLYSGACDRSILVWEKDKVTGGSHMAVTGALRGHTKAILCLAATASDLVCSGSADNTVRIWRRGAGKRYSCLAMFEGHRRPVKCLAIGVDLGSSNYLIYSGSLDGEIKIWRIAVPILL